MISPRIYKINIFRIKFLLIFAFLIFKNHEGICKTFYVSNKGNDNGTAVQAQNPKTPWATIEKLNTILLSPGGFLFHFKRNDIFFGELIINNLGNKGNKIVIGAYGSGNSPIISGVIKISNWNNSKIKNIYTSELDKSIVDINQLFINDKYQEISRYPKTGFLIDSLSDNRIILRGVGENFINQIKESSIVIRSVRWAFEKEKISSMPGNAIILKNTPYYSIKNKKFGYFIENTLLGLNNNGSWYYDKTNNLLMIYLQNRYNDLNNITISKYDYGINITNGNNIIVRDINFFGQKRNSINLRNCKCINILNCNFNEAGFSGIYGIDVDSCLIDGNYFSSCKNNGIKLNGSYSSVITNNEITKTGLFAGEGKNGSHGLIALDIEGDYTADNIVSNNVIDSTGYISLLFSGKNMIIKNNYINHSCILLDDGSAIYTGVNSNLGNIIENNIILNVLGSGKGMPDSTFTLAQGIYLDDFTCNVTVKGNTVINADNGIYLHNGINNLFCNNKLINNRVSQIFLNEDGGKDHNSFIKGNKINNNLFFNAYPEEKSIYFISRSDDINNFAKCDSNYYYNLFSSASYIALINPSHKYYLDLKEWNQDYNQDINSTVKSSYSSIYKINKTINVNMISNSNFSNGITNWYTWSSNKNSVLTKITYNYTNYLKVSLKDYKINTDFLVYTNNFAVDTSNYYHLSFEAFGTKNFFLQIEPRIAHSPYSLLTNIDKIKINRVPQHYNYIFKSKLNDKLARIDFESKNTDSSYYITNVKLNKVAVTKYVPSELIKIFINSSNEVQSYNIVPDEFFDIYGKKINGNFLLKPYTCYIAIKE